MTRYPSSKLGYSFILMSKLSMDSAASLEHTAARRHSAELAADTEAESGTAGL